MGVSCWSSSWQCATPTAIQEQKIHIVMFTGMFLLNSICPAVTKGFIQFLF